ncbi:MAG: hypothetical protein AB1512_13330 [Thermodesulfobacteriota bacterium]
MEIILVPMLLRGNAGSGRSGVLRRRRSARESVPTLEPWEPGKDNVELGRRKDVLV